MLSSRKFSIKNVDIYGVICISIVIFYSIFSGFRPENVGTDTERYIDLYKSLASNHVLNRDIEIGFSFLSKTLAIFDSPEFYLFSITLIITLLFSNAFSLGINWNFSILTYCFFLSPFFFGQTLNILRQGLSLAIVVNYLVLTKSSNFYKSLLFSTIAGSFHNTGLIFSALTIFAKKITLKTAFFIWTFGFLIGIINANGSALSQALSLLISDEYYLSYLDTINAEFRVGYRYDFLLFSITPIATLFIAKKFASTATKEKFNGQEVESIVKIYLIFNSFANIFIQMPYSDRWFNWSWSLYPIFLYYIIIHTSKEKYKKFISLLMAILSVISIFSNYNIIASIKI